MYKEIIEDEKARIENAIRAGDTEYLNRRYHGIANAKRRLNSLNHILSFKKCFSYRKAAAG